MWVFSDHDTVLPPPNPAPVGIQGFWDTVFAGFKIESVEMDYWNMFARTESDILADVQDRVSSIIGEDELDRQISERHHDRRRDRHGTSSAAYRNALLGIAEEVAMEQPGLFGEMPLSRDAVRNETVKRLREEYQEAEDVLSMGGTAPGLAEMLGRGSAAATDPVSLALMFAGGPASSIGRLIAREALINATAEAAMLPQRFAQAERLGLPKPHALLQIVQGAAYGGAFTLGGKALFIAGRIEMADAFHRSYIYAKERVNSTLGVPKGVEPAEGLSLIRAAEDALSAGRLPTNLTIASRAPSIGQTAALRRLFGTHNPAAQAEIRRGRETGSETAQIDTNAPLRPRTGSDTRHAMAPQRPTAPRTEALDSPGRQPLPNAPSATPEGRFEAAGLSSETGPGFQPVTPNLDPVKLAGEISTRTDAINRLIDDAELEDVLVPTDVEQATHRLMRDGGTPLEALREVVARRLDDGLHGQTLNPAVGQPTTTNQARPRATANIATKTINLTAQADMFDDIAKGTARPLYAKIEADLKAVAEVDDFEVDLGAGSRPLSEYLDDLEQDAAIVELLESCRP